MPNRSNMRPRAMLYYLCRHTYPITPYPYHCIQPSHSKNNNPHQIPTICTIMKPSFIILHLLTLASISPLSAQPTPTVADTMATAAPCSTTCNFSKTQLIQPSSPAITYTGRIDFTNAERPRFTYPGIEIRISFTGSSIAMKAKPHSGHFIAQVDNNAPIKISFADNDTFIISNTLNTDSLHTLTITYINEGYQSLPEFRGFLIDRNQKAIRPASTHKHTIEFIGNSITCGYGIEAENATDPYTEETANYYYTYAALTSRRLQAQACIVARSGIGVYRNYNGPTTGDCVNMNTEYPFTLIYNNTIPWDFSRFIPELVCINLGTNDTSTQGADTTLLLNGYLNLYRQVRLHYPQATILLLSGCMMKDQQLDTARKAMDKAVSIAKQQGENNIYRFDLTPHDGSLGYGASYHPSIRQHQKMADELVPYIQQIMGW